MKRLWEFFDGYKTIIGGVSALVIGGLELQGVIPPETAKILITIAGLLFGTGVVHKMYKKGKTQ